MLGTKFHRGRTALRIEKYPSLVAAALMRRSSFLRTESLWPTSSARLLIFYDPKHDLLAASATCLL